MEPPIAAGAPCIRREEAIPVDEHRGMQAQQATEIRRRLHEVEADHALIRDRQEEFEAFLLQGPATSWPEAAAKAQYLIRLFAAMPQADNPRRQALIASVLEDLTRLS